jgi:hypothetical protein
MRSNMKNVKNEENGTAIFFSIAENLWLQRPLKCIYGYSMTVCNYHTKRYEILPIKL